MRKALLVTTVSGFVPQFEMNNVKILQELGYEVHYAANYNTPVYGEDNSRLENTGIICHQVDFVRSPFQIIKNIKALVQLIQIMREDNYQLVHCHTPMGGVLARIAAFTTRTAPVIYTAHGFHFYKGAPLLNWLMYYPVEKLLARITDSLIVINQEDQKNAHNFHLRGNGKLWYIPGVGLKKQAKRTAKEYYQFREKLGISPDMVVLTSVGELTKRKNQIQIIEAMKAFRDKKVKYLICGTGAEEQTYLNYIRENHLEKQVILMGYRTDVADILKASDIFIFPSKQEGLPVALMEAMQIGLPVICSDIRGNQDLIKDRQGGCLIKNDNIPEYINAIKALSKDNKMRRQMGMWNHQQMENFLLDKVEERMRLVYEYHSSDHVHL
ncbi:glycosyltransferase family 1 protein [Clostridiales bacterium COT073_COT-073]|nr:glycosyltransferase family 1 protein [Clostridiales bacterium COT073_COT-073]